MYACGKKSREVQKEGGKRERERGEEGREDCSWIFKLKEGARCKRKSDIKVNGSEAENAQN